MSDPMRSYSVTVKMTPRQAIEAADALHHAAVGRGSSRLFSAAHRINCGLWDAGWDSINRGTEDEPKWQWRLPRRP
jgi:hypothetical protein